MSSDPIVDEVRQIREMYAQRFQYDIDAIFRDLKALEQASGRTFVSLPPRRPEPIGSMPPSRRETT